MCRPQPPHGDPVCAFDGSGCLAVVLVFAIVPGASGEQANLSAGAGTPANSWSAAGIAVESGAVVPAIDPKPAARSIRVAQGTATSGNLELKVVKQDGEQVADLTRTSAEQKVELEAGTYLLRLSRATTGDLGEFVFAICAGGC